MKVGDKVIVRIEWDNPFKAEIINLLNTQEDGVVAEVRNIDSIPNNPHYNQISIIREKDLEVI